MNTTANVLRFALVISVGAAVGYAGMHQIENKKSEYAAEVSDNYFELRKKERDEQIKKSVDTFDLSKGEFERANYIHNITSWTDQIESMPETKERDSFAAAIVEVTRDDAITDDEYKKLRNQKRALDDFNVNIITKENAANIRDGKPIADYRTDGEKAYANRLSAVEAALRWAEIKGAESSKEYETWEKEYEANNRK